MAGIKPLTAIFSRQLNPFGGWRNLGQLARWSALVVPAAVLAGSASALFLWGLDWVTRARWSHPWLLYLLPAGGVAIALLYQLAGRGAERGNNLILEEIHEPGAGVPVRMAPLVLLGTWVTHLLGGSAGREGTALQMGASLAAGYGRALRLQADDRRVLLLAGIAAGFGSVFGTPLTGAIFALEVAVVGQIRYDALVPVLIASIVGDATCSAWGIHHTLYHVAVAGGARPPGALGGLALSIMRLVAATVASGILFGMVAKVFAESVHALQQGFERWFPWAPLRPALGGVAVILLVTLVGTRDYLGIGVTSPNPAGVSILAAFAPGNISWFSWGWKLLFTVVTLGAGFKGGEVTPLFFIGATLGHTLAAVFGMPVDLWAAMGFVAVFAGAANTPLACTVMGAELFGAVHLPYFAAACFLAYYFSGHAGIYRSQKIAVRKHTDE